MQGFVYNIRANRIEWCEYICMELINLFFYRKMYHKMYGII